MLQVFVLRENEAHRCTVDMAGMEQIEDQKQQWVTTLSGWSPEQLRQRPAGGGWSALEMLDHMVRTEMEILLTVRQGLSQPHRIAVADKLRTRFLENVFRSERKVKVPASASKVLPGANLEFAEIVDRWDGSRLALRSLLASESPERLQAGLFRHPVGGWMGMPQVLEFFSVHLLHHEYQLARLQAASS